MTDLLNRHWALRDGVPKLPSAPVATAETVVENAETGGRKARKLARFDLLPADALRQVAEHYGRGAKKYADRNWELGYDWSLSFGAMQRHLWAFWSGQDVDAETGSHHLAAAAFHCLALLTFADTCPELDDRPEGSQQVRMATSRPRDVGSMGEPTDPNAVDWKNHVFLTVPDYDVDPEDGAVTQGELVEELEALRADILNELDKRIDVATAVHGNPWRPIGPPPGTPPWGRGGRGDLRSLDDAQMQKYGIPNQMCPDIEGKDL